MALSQKGASYEDRNYIRDQHVLRALDDLASQVQSVASNTNASKVGVAAAPAAPVAIAVVNSGGFARITISPARNAVQGTAYILEYSPNANFSGTPQRIDNGISLTAERYLHGQTLYFRVASTLYTSPLSPWVYFGGSAAPTPTAF
jgi:hypothetical protein